MNKGVLVVAGCSHTQGSAFVKSLRYPVKSNPDEYELITSQLKEKYGRETVTGDWITNNLTWGGKLGKILNMYKVINLGLGGTGIESTIRAVTNYSYITDNLSNHLFVIQVPASERKEIFFNDGWHWTLNTLGNISKTRSEDFPEVEKAIKYYIKYFFDFDLNEIHSFYNLLRLVNYLKARQAEVRLILKPFYTLKLDKKAIDDEYQSKILKLFHSISFNKNQIQTPTFEQILNSLNILNLSDLPQCREEYLENPKIITLHSDGTVIDDYHYNEDGNYALAQCIKRNLNNIETFKLK